MDSWLSDQPLKRGENTLAPSLLSLPTELWLNELVPWLALESSVDRRYMISLSSTCRSIRQLFAPLLFQRIGMRIPFFVAPPFSIEPRTLYTDDSLKAFMCQAYSMAHSAITGCVRRFRLSPQPVYNYANARQEILIRKSGTLPQEELQKEVQSRYWRARAAEYVLDLLPKFSSLTQLVLEDLDLVDSQTRQILAIEQLKVLNIYKCKIAFQSIEGDHELPRLALRTLLVGDLGDAVLPVVFLRAVIGPHLDTLDVTDTLSEPILAALERVGPLTSLRTLRLNDLRDVFDPLTSFGPSCPNVCHLAITSSRKAAALFPVIPTAFARVTSFTGAIFDSERLVTSARLEDLVLRSSGAGDVFLRFFTSSRGNLTQLSSLALRALQMPSALPVLRELASTCPRLRGLRLTMTPSGDGGRADMTTFMNALESVRLPPRLAYIDIYCGQSDISEEQSVRKGFTTLLRRWSVYNDLHFIELRTFPLGLDEAGRISKQCRIFYDRSIHKKIGSDARLQQYILQKC